MKIKNILKSLNISEEIIPGVFDGKVWKASGEIYNSLDTTRRTPISQVIFGSSEDYERCMKNMLDSRKEWARTPAPKRGDVIRVLGSLLRDKKEDLGSLISLEMGKIKSEGIGEVVEFIDMCDYAVGLSRTLSGSIFPSERSSHSMMEVWNPIGSLGLITAFNFPCAVFGWNTCLNLVCGNTQITKGSESASLVTIATQKLITQALQETKFNPAIAVLCQGSGRIIGRLMVNDKRLPLISFTGSTEVGREINTKIASRFGRGILELGGNNAMIIMNDADVDMAIRSVLFAAVGTCGQRCTTLRRLMIHQDIYDSFLGRLNEAYANVKIGDPLDEKNLVGPLHSEKSFKLFHNTVKKALKQGGRLIYPSKFDGVPPNFVKPTIIEINLESSIVQEENFVPILYVNKFSCFEEAIKLNNSVSQGLTSSLFTKNVSRVFKWLEESDCGIVNVNTSCSGAEIGGAFGGNKDTGGGRESGSDSWKQYMRRSTCVINHGKELPLAQGIKF